MHFLFILQLRSPEPANHSTDVIAKRLCKIEAACREKKNWYTCEVNEREKNSGHKLVSSVLGALTSQTLTSS
jgi:hypothetical protein